jgi:hypothetical protein|tara:strand:+ start:10359 stop:10562 length:204 start_codon:yes stop_codon:yes gene_type:complete
MIINEIGINSKLKIKAIHETLVNVKIKKSVEKTGFFAVITSNEESRDKALKTINKILQKFIKKFIIF